MFSFNCIEPDQVDQCQTNRAILDAWTRYLSFTLKVSKFPTSGGVSRPAPPKKNKFYEFLGCWGSQITTSMQFTFRLIQFSKVLKINACSSTSTRKLPSECLWDKSQASSFLGRTSIVQTDCQENPREIPWKFSEDFFAENASDSRPKRTIFRSSQSHATRIWSERGWTEQL